MRSPSPSRRLGAFSLIELIVVIGIIVVIATFAVPAATTVLRGTQITQAADNIAGQISLARQTALAKNRVIEVRFYRYSDPETPGEKADEPETGKFRGMQVFEVVESGAALPVGKIIQLPQTVIFSDLEKFSTLLAETTRTKKKPLDVDPELPRVKKDYEYVSFRFLPNGTTDLPVERTAGSNGKQVLWFLTIHSLTEKVDEDTKSPSNFFTVQIDSQSGALKTYRPTAG